MVGLLLLLFVAYQFWGTGLYTAQAQNDLQDQFDAGPQASTTTTTAGRHVNDPPTDNRRPDDRALGASPAPPEATRWAASASPRSVSTSWWSRAVDVDDLAQGPRPLPEHADAGSRGNAAIAGHRTTYGAPFGDLDQLARGDEIRVVTLQGTWYYVLSTTRRGEARPDRGPRPDDRPGHGSAAGHPHPHDVQPQVPGRAASHHPGAARATRPAEPLPAPDRTKLDHRYRPVRRSSDARRRSSLGTDLRWRSACCGGCCSTATRAGRPGSSAWSRSSSCSSSPTRTSTASCPTTTEGGTGALPADAR